MKPTRLYCLALVFATLRSLSAADLSVATKQVSKEEAEQWLRWVIPLPRQIAIDRKAVVPADQVAITLAPKASPLERSGAAGLAEVLKKKTGAQIRIGEGRNAETAFQIVIGTCGKDGRLAGRPVPGAERLFTLPSAEQAYRIVPLADHRLALVGTAPQGVYYAAKTFKQLLSASSFNADKATSATIPLAEVTDWPDLAERGLWGGSANEDIEWLAERKMNLVESHVELSLSQDGRGTAVIPTRLLARAQRHAVKLVPIITHLEQLPPAVFARYPQLKAVGDEKVWRRIGDVTPVCFSQPKAQEILVDWLTCLARYPEVTDVNVWLSENEVPCQCEKCKAVNPFVLQTRLALRAWEAAKRIKPTLRLRMLLTQGSYRSNDKVLAGVPREVGITYYDGGRTYDSSREPMIYPLLEKYAAEGRWLGCYPQLTASWRIVCPWSGPQFIKARMSEFAAKRLQCLCGYATPSNRFYEFNVTAAAEWSWNASGRSEREFSLAWATRQGLADPEKAADWAVTLGPVGWDVYGGRVPFIWVYSGVAGMLQQGKPRLGSGIFVYFPTKEHFDHDLAVCERAMHLAQDVQAPALVEETRVIRGMVRMLKGLYLMAAATAAGKKMAPDDRQRAAAALALIDEGSRDAHDGLLSWGAAVAPELVPKSLGSASRLADTLECLERIAAEASDVAQGLGINDPGRPYRARLIGGWTTEDFKAGAAQKKTWEVTRFLAGTGRYQVMFNYDSGWYGAGIKCVSLVSALSDNAAQPTEVSRDRHEGVTGYQPKDTVYELMLREHDPKRRYFVVADLVGAPRNSPPEHSGCVGHATMKKMRQ